MLAGRALYLLLAPLAGLCYLFFLGLRNDSQNRTSSHSKLAAYRQDHNSESWYHVDGVSGHTWQTDTLKEREDILFDGVRRFIRTSRYSRPSTLFLVLTEDASSWGSDTNAPARTFTSFLTMINSTNLPLSECALGILTSSESEYIAYRNATLTLPFSRITILLKLPPPDSSNPYTSIPRGGRHSKSFQTIRRANVALLRNELQSRTLHDERHLIWIDADIKILAPNIIQSMIHHSETTPTASIITALANTSWFPDYDKNAFQGFRPPPATHISADPAIAAEEAAAVPKFVGELVHGTTDEDLLPLDSVGGTILYVRASLVHQGLTFPPYYVVGTRWGRDGWDGIETQGLCYVANYLTGGGCWTLGGGYYVEHTSS